nr:hypothetical protein Iba_chr13aCG9570 [Ipomoea batatas]
MEHRGRKDRRSRLTVLEAKAEAADGEATLLPVAKPKLDTFVLTLVTAAHDAVAARRSHYSRQTLPLLKPPTLSHRRRQYGKESAAVITFNLVVNRCRPRKPR